MTFSDEMHARAQQLQRAMAEWTEDAIMSAMCARLPVDCVRHYFSDPFYVEVVLPGGVVFASRRWRLVS